MVRHLKHSKLAMVSALIVAGCGHGPSPDPSPAPRSSPEAQAPIPAPRTVQPGAPGQASRAIDASNISNLGGVEYVAADVHFMQGMIPHHAQALQMTAMVSDRTNDPGLRSLALRMEISQRDEIGLMARWLRNREESVPASAAFVDPDAVLASLEMIGHEGMDHGNMDHGDMEGMAMMPGMLTPDQMVQLKAARDVEFERLFLEFMIQHHNGAIIMVSNLFATDGAAQESDIFQFASHVDADQQAEIDRMQSMLNARSQGRDQ